MIDNSQVFYPNDLYKYQAYQLICDVYHFLLILHYHEHNITPV